MSEEDRKKLIKGLEMSSYKTLRRKAMLNENVVQSDETGEMVVVPAREVFTKLYNEPVP
ncbi:MAG: ribosome recycling factor [Bacteroidaceae bacterium]|nr:ribosome recycling factor [Bacteroidaceae bacterium]